MILIHPNLLQLTSTLFFFLSLSLFHHIIYHIYHFLSALIVSLSSLHPLQLPQNPCLSFSIFFKNMESIFLAYTLKRTWLLNKIFIIIFVAENNAQRNWRYKKVSKNYQTIALACCFLFIKFPNNPFGLLLN